MYPIEKYFDKNGLIGNFVRPGLEDELGRNIGPEGWVDGGDTTQRMGMYHIGLWAYRKEFGDKAFSRHMIEKGYKDYMGGFLIKALEKLESKMRPGVYKRNSDPNFWYSDDDRMSRDQAFPLFAAMGALGFKSFLKRAFWSHLKRGLLFTTNTRRNGATAANHRVKEYAEGKTYNYNWKLPDITFLSFWSLYIRGFNLWWLYPLLLVCDLEFFVNSILKNTIKKDDHVVENHCVEAVYFTYKYPTPLIWFANKYINKADDMIARLRKYFRGDRDPYFVGEIYEPILEKIMK